MIRQAAIMCLIFCSLTAAAQQASSHWGIGSQIHKGFVIIHSEDIRAVEDSYPFGIGIDLLRTRSSLQAWNQCKCFPAIGLSFIYWNFDNPEVLGFGISTLFFLEPEFAIWKKFHFSFRAGFGISYLSNPYDETHNPDNQSYSTTFAFPLQLTAFLNYRVQDQWMIKLGANYNHISNGGLREPNKGINYPTASLGINYYFNKPLPAKPHFPESSYEFSLQRRVEVFAFGSLKQVKSGDYQPLWGAGGAVYWPVSKINAMGGQLEITHHLAQQQKNELNNIESSAFYLGVAVSNDFPLGKFHFSQSFGYYLVNLYAEDYNFYQRYGLTYEMSPGLLFGIALRAHGHVADFLDVRMGWQW